MTAPGWMNAVIGDFARSAGFSGLALNERGTAAINFETGASFRMEYTGTELAVAVLTPAPSTGEALQEAVRRLLSISHPMARHGFAIRTGYLAKAGRLALAVRLAERDVTLPRVNGAFGVLWRLAGEIGGATWA